MDLYCCYIL